MLFALSSNVVYPELLKQCYFEHAVALTLSMAKLEFPFFF